MCTQCTEINPISIVVHKFEITFWLGVTSFVDMFSSSLEEMIPLNVIRNGAVNGRCVSAKLEIHSWEESSGGVLEWNIDASTDDSGCTVILTARIQCLSFESSMIHSIGLKVHQQHGSVPMSTPSHGIFCKLLFNLLRMPILHNCKLSLLLAKVNPFCTGEFEVCACRTCSRSPTMSMPW